MPTQIDQEFQRTLELQRIETLCSRLPASVTAVMVGVLLVFVYLLPATPSDLLKAWAAYMLTTVAFRGWIWHSFRSGDQAIGTARRWEWAFAFGMGLTGLGWAALNGPMYPQEPDLQVFVILMTVVTAFTGAVYASVSHIAFWMFVTPTLGSAIARFVSNADNVFHADVVAVVACVVVILSIQRSLHRFALEHIHRRVESESLLHEQQAVFQSSPLGIVVISDRRVVKANTRLGELYGRSLQDLQKHVVDQLFAHADEAHLFAEESRAALKAGKTWSGVYRMRRGDGSEFWGELSGRMMPNDGHQRSVWTVADVSLRVEPKNSEY
jgi:PAS domain S-box-containing protein